jgi:hypothetical protein
MTAGTVYGRLTGVNLLALGTQVLVPQATGEAAELNLLPQFIYVVMRTLTGPALSVSPKFRIGANGTHDDVAPIFTVPLGVQLNVFALLPLVAFPFTPVNLKNVSVLMEVTQAGVGPTACSGDVLLVGLQVGA